MLLWWLILILMVLAGISAGGNGVFRQKRIGKDGKPFDIYKLRTMKMGSSSEDTVTIEGDHRLTSFGVFLRKYKLDELPQLWNVLKGDMSLVGPRPDVPGFADQLSGRNRRILELRPGITGPASLKFRDEEKTLATQSDPPAYNREVIWPQKVKINVEYADSHSFFGDVGYILKSLIAGTKS